MNFDLAGCRVCGVMLSNTSFNDAGPSLTSIRTVLDVPTQVWLCDTCGHAQSPDLPDIPEFYDTQYRISLDIDGHDQLYENKAGEQVFRTAFQAEMLLNLAIPSKAKVLDFGSGKATTLQRLVKARPDIIPYVFDVSSDYLDYWADWVPVDHQATYKLPQEWSAKFDLITAHFVLEHVASPVEVLTELMRCLAPSGQLFFSVPDAEGNSGDLLVVDHLSHFTLSSVTIALANANLIIESIDRDAFAGAFVIIAKKGLSNISPVVDINDLRKTLIEWERILIQLSKNKPDGPIAIYGAGFYGSIILTRLSSEISCFLDSNSYLQGQEHFRIPVYKPMDCPGDIKTVIVGLNPARARNILSNSAEWLPEGAKLIYLD